MTGSIQQPAHLVKEVSGGTAVFSDAHLQRATSSPKRSKDSILWRLTHQDGSWRVLGEAKLFQSSGRYHFMAATGREKNKAALTALQSALLLF